MMHPPSIYPLVVPLFEKEGLRGDFLFGQIPFVSPLKRGKMSLVQKKCVMMNYREGD